MPELLTTGGTAVAGGALGSVLTNLYNRWKQDMQYRDFKNDINSEIKNLEIKIEDLQLDIAKNYITRDEVKDALRDIGETLRRIESKVDKKADKT